MPTGTKIAALTLVAILAAAGLYYAFVAPSTPASGRAAAPEASPTAPAPATTNGLGSQSPTTLRPAVPSVGAGPSASTTTPAIGALAGSPAPTGSPAGSGAAPRADQPGFNPGSLGAAGTGKGDLPDGRPTGLSGGTINGLPARSLTATPIGPSQPTAPQASPGNAETPAPGSDGPRPVTPARATPGVGAASAASGAASGQEQVHVVASGDTLSSIAKRYLGKESAWTAIARANPGVDPTAMRVGTRLRIPAADAAGTTAAASTPAAANTGSSTTGSSTTGSSTTGSSTTGSSTTGPSRPATASGGATTSHTVVAGDTLSSIARKHFGDGKYWEEIYAANKATIGSDPAVLKVGQRLTLPAIR